MSVRKTMTVKSDMTERMTQTWHQRTTGTSPQEHLATEQVTGSLQSENPEQGSSNTSSWPFYLRTLLPLPHFQYSFTSTFIHIKMCFLDSPSNIRLIFDGIFFIMKYYLVCFTLIP